MIYWTENRGSNKMDSSQKVDLGFYLSKLNIWRWMIKLGLLSKVFLKKGEVFWRFCRFFSQNLFKINTRRHSFFTAIFWHFHQLFTQFSIFRWCESFTYFSWIKMDFRILWRRTLLQKLGHLLLTKKRFPPQCRLFCQISRH